MDINDINIDLKPGDIIFISIPNFLYQQVEKGTGSRASHVGILFKDDHSNWVVAESRVPLSKYTPLSDYLRRTKDNWCCIRRPKMELLSEDVDALKEACNNRLGILYHLGFRYDSNRQFCSKFVYDAYKEAIGIEVGELDTMRNLFVKRPDTPLMFWRLWYFGFIPWGRRTVTPASQMESEALKTIYTTTL